jgi:hypothetical protein
VTDRPQAISSTTDLSAGKFGNRGQGGSSSSWRGTIGGDPHNDDEDHEQEDGMSDLDGAGGGESDTSSISSFVSSSSSTRRKISRLPRTTSTQSLTDRFVSTGIEGLDPAKEEGARSLDKEIKREDKGEMEVDAGVEGDHGEVEDESPVIKMRRVE